VASNQTFQCPSCGAALTAQGEARQVKCPYCGTQVIVPDSLRTPQAAAQPWPPQVVVVQAPAAASAAPPARSSVGGCLTALVFIVVLLGVVGGLVFLSLAPGGSTSGISINVPQGDFATVVSQPFIEPTREPTPTLTPGFASAVLQFGSEGTGAGFFTDARGVAADGEGNIFVSEYTSGRVQRFDKEGKYLNGWKTEGKTPLRGLAADRAGNVYVVRGGTILKYNGADGTLLDTFKGEQGDNFDDVTVLADGSLLAFSYHNQDDLVWLSAQGQVLNRIEKAISGLSSQPELQIRVAADGLGNVFALGTFNNAVFRFAPDGKYVTYFGSQGDEPGQFRAPLAIAVDNQSRVYVGEGARIQVFDSGGRYLAQIDDAGSALGMRFTAQNELLVAARDHVVKMTLNQP
jgi:DNA-directed RNA polymerase subunit RPC12/RpoP